MADLRRRIHVGAQIRPAEGIGSFAVRAQVIQFGQCLGQCGLMTVRNPPHDKMHVAQHLKPFSAPFHEFCMQRVKHKCFQLGRSFPDSQVGDVPWIAVYCGGGVALARFAFHHPDKTRHAFAKPVDPVKIAHELSNARVVFGGDQAANVEFSKLHDL